MWREYNFLMGYSTPNFDKMSNNPIARRKSSKIRITPRPSFVLSLTHLRPFPDTAWLCMTEIPWDDDPELVAAWKEARTGYPYIDAVMTQLRETGWIHHLARHSVACFLTRGDLWQSWERGAAVFDEFLLDADWSINNFNWQWLSCTAHFYQYFRCYSPISFGKKTDPNGDYIRKWLPLFKNMPAKYFMNRGRHLWIFNYSVVW
jgi:cryptochrome